MVTRYQAHKTTRFAPIIGICNNFALQGNCPVASSKPPSAVVVSVIALGIA